MPDPHAVLLLGCVSLTVDAPRLARDLDVSDLVGQRRAEAEDQGLPWFVLSADRGLLRPDDLVSPHDLDLREQPASYRLAWGAWVIERLRHELGSLTGVRLEVHAGEAYAGALAEAAHEAGATLIRPSQGPRQADPAGVFVTSLRDVTRAVQLEYLEESRVPTTPGLYSWWVDEPGAAALASGLGHRVDPGIIYVGQAGATRWPSGQRSPNSLRGRLIGMHRDGTVNFSAFRRNLAASLSLLGAGRADEGALTDWMRLHLAVAWRSSDDVDGLAAVERDVLAELDPVLNLRGMPASEVRLELKRRRSKKGLLAARACKEPAAGPELPSERCPGGHGRLNVTKKDFARGQIRITREAKREMRLMEATDLQVCLQGEMFFCQYDPRLGPDKERSGLVRLGAANLVRVLGGPVALKATRSPDGVLDLA